MWFRRTAPPIAFFICLSAVPVDAETLSISAEQRTCVEHQIRLRLSLNVKYLWGGSGESPDAPRDCSGMVESIFRTCGIGPIRRLPAADMAAGRGGWTLVPVLWRDGKAPGLIFFRFGVYSGKREVWHVGIMSADAEDSGVRFVHMSQRRGFVESIMDSANVFRRNYAGTRNFQ